ncbi:MAG TPA: 3-oxoacyl-[acyl-carrier-protein] reductase [Limnochordia bacterium]|nr:3-oxoacyl-[acyl-carrier-protein] reductase [Limnochordia bacterium]
MTLAQRTALVTGSTRGIGRAIAQRLAADGARVAVCGRDERVAAQVAETIVAAGGEAIGVALEVSDPASVEAAVARCEERLGGIDILVNNAGITRDGLLVRMSADDWDRVIDVNLGGIYRCTKAVVRGMIKRRRGRIINISSISGLVGNAGQANYAASKAAIVGFTKSLARELAGRGITVNAVAPGFIDTDMTDALTDAQKVELVKSIPLGQTGKPEDIAAAVAYLASDDAGYVTGHTLVVDGGFAM